MVIELAEDENADGGDYTTFIVDKVVCMDNDDCLGWLDPVPTKIDDDDDDDEATKRVNNGNGLHAHIHVLHPKLLTGWVVQAQQLSCITQWDAHGPDCHSNVCFTM